MVPEKVREVVNYVYRLADTLRRALDSAAREVEACAGASWTGGSAEAFADGWSETRTGGNTTIAAFTEMAEKLGVTADTYTKRANIRQITHVPNLVRCNDLDELLRRLQRRPGRNRHRVSYSADRACDRTSSMAARRSNTNL
ncbi:WXG100 family type VII secretion target [Nocardia salmonicida]|uniref:WXG100 family type VII secretion target n=1 Tax=Nocardia salmonicida TaxID=53431 RepID=UPI00362F0C81